MDIDELPREREDSDKPHREDNGLSLATKVYVSILILASLSIIILYIIPNYKSPKPPCGGSYCSCTSQDAKNVLAALASYFSEPENMRMPTVEVLISDADLGLNNPVENVILYPEPGESAKSQPIRVMVIDDWERCPRNSSYVHIMGNRNGYWK